jgi:hypothetical protein
MMSSDEVFIRRQRSANLAKILGGAAINGEFFRKLKDDPRQALIDINVEPTEDLIRILKSIDYSSLKSFHEHVAGLINSNFFLWSLEVFRRTSSIL